MPGPLTARRCKILLRHAPGPGIRACSHTARTARPDTSRAQIFYRVHLFTAAVFVIFSFLHYKALINWIMPGLILYFIDRAGYR